MLQKLKDFRELVMFEHSIFSMPFIFIAMITAAHGWFGWELLAFGVVASVSARNFAMGFNRFADRKFDKTNPRTQNRPSVDGRISPKAMLLFIVVNALIFIAMGYVGVRTFFRASTNCWSSGGFRRDSALERIFMYWCVILGGRI